MKGSETSLALQKLLQASDDVLLRFKRTLEKEQHCQSRKSVFLYRRVWQLIRIASVVASLSVIIAAAWFLIK